MARKRLTQEKIDTILLKSRRRCCICYGLYRDTMVKAGQIAHLDRDSTNDRLENLAFLCLEHHDLFDRTTSQSKGLTITEVIAYREELYSLIYESLKQPVKIGDLSIDPPDEIAGRYIWKTSVASAELELIRLSVDRVKVIGYALWGTNKKGGPNIGLLDFESILEGGQISHSKKLELADDKHVEYNIEICFQNGRLYVKEEPQGSVHGMNVTFSGVYSRTNDIVWTS